MKKLIKKGLASFTLLTLELLLAWGLLIACFSIFFYLTHLVFIDKNLYFDYTTYQFTQDHSSPTLTKILRFVTFFASFPFLLGASLFTAFYFLIIHKHKWYSLKVAVMALGGTLLNQALKFFFERPRPTTEITNFSFPSGHTMIGLTYYGVLIYICWVNIKNKVLRFMVCSLLVLWILLIGYSRVYLHVHYTTDVIAGLAGGIAWLIAGIYLLKRIERFTKREVNPVVETNSPAES